PPPCDLIEERENGDVIRALIGAGLVSAAHDISDGGLLVAIAEMAMASAIGASLDAVPEDTSAHAFWFGEDQARYVVTVPADRGDTVIRRVQASSVPVHRVGTTGGNALAIPGERAVNVNTLAERFEGWLPGYMSGAA